MMSSRTLFCRLVVVLTVAILASPGEAEERIWTDKTGKFQLSAEMVDVSDGEVRLKRPDGRIVSVPVARLSEADQAFLESAAGGGTAGADAPWKVGDKAYIQTRGQWQLGVLTKIHDGPGSARYELTLRTGAKRSMRVTEMRLRRYGKAGDKGMLLPGDVVEVLDTWGKEVINTGVIASVSRNRAMVRVEGELGEKSFWLKSLRAPGAGDGTSLSGRVASAADRSRKPGQKTHPGDKLTYPAPELTPVNLGLARPVELTVPGASSTIRLDIQPKVIPVDRMRPFPVKLTPKKHRWDEFPSISIAADGSLGAVLRTTHENKQSQLELVPTYKSRSKPELHGLPPNTKQAQVSPDGRHVMTLRSETFDKHPKIDIWRVDWQTNEKKAIANFSHQVSWTTDLDNESRYKLGAARWLAPGRLLTVDSKRAVVWDAATGEPRRMLPVGKHCRLAPGTDMLMVNRSDAGVVFVNLATMSVAAVIGAGEAMSGTPSISPSGAKMLLSGRDGLIELWDLARGKKLIQMMVVQPDGKLASRFTGWSLEEAYLMSGNRPVDIRTWEPFTDGRLPQRSFAGARWSIAEPRGKPPLLGGVQTLPPLADASIRPNTRGPFALKPGDTVSLDIQVDREIADATRARLTQMVESQGFVVGDGGRVTLRASTRVKSKSQEYTKRPFGRTGEKGNFTVSYKVREYSIDLLLDKQKLWSTLGSQSASLSPAFTNEKEVRSQAAEKLVPEASYFTAVTLPEHILAPGG